MIDGRDCESDRAAFMRAVAFRLPTVTGCRTARWRRPDSHRLPVLALQPKRDRSQVSPPAAEGTISTGITDPQGTSYCHPPEVAWDAKGRLRRRAKRACPGRHPATSGILCPA
jgi:hypothetical protein